jgi:hypothetical protein
VLTHPEIVMAKPRSTPSRAKPAPKLLVVLSDLHAGSDVGLLPEKVELDDGQTLGHGSNPWQKWLWGEWLKMQEWVEKVTGGDDFSILLNGDLIEGLHHRSDEVMAAKIMEHCTIAKTALTPLVDASSEIYATRGTECHTRDLETYLMRSMGKDKAHDFIQLNFNGVLVDCRHHMSVTSRLHLEASGLAIVAANNRSNAIRAGHAPARIFLRGHRHIPGMYSDGEVLVAVTGAWQGLTRHGKKVVTDSIPRPSCIILDARNTPHGELPAIHHRVFNPPQNLVAHCV